MSDWHDFLATRGARFEASLVRDFGDPDGELGLAASGDLLADLAHLGLVRISGPDGPALLQGQQTNDVREVSPVRSQLAGICSNKGRLVATYRVVWRDDALYLVMSRAQVASVAKRLALYVLRARAQVAEATDELVLLGLQGTAAAERAQAILGALPSGPSGAGRSGEHTVVRLPGSVPRLLLMSPPASAPVLWDALATAARPVGRAAWDLSEIYAGLPQVYPETADAFVPQMVNLHAVGGVSFTKGCYTGQEVVARTQYLGRLKRHMYRAHVDASAPPRPGQDLYSPSDPSGQSVGKVVSAERNPAGGYELLAVIQNEAALAPVHLGAADGPLLALGELPYTL